MDEKILMELVDGILRIMRSRIVSIILYGSTARGTSTKESDVDVAILMQGNTALRLREKVTGII